MCYHYSLSQKFEKLQQRFNLDDLNADELQEYLFYHANGFAHPYMPVITNEQPNRLQFFRWGLIPNWVKDLKSAKEIWNKTLNARGESIFEKPSFKNSANRKRCLVPADGFFEYQTMGKTKTPHYIHLKNCEIFAFGGLWERWIDKTGGEVYETFSIVTTPANDLMSEIHNAPAHSETARMPLILPVEAESLWLKSLDELEVMTLMKPFLNEALIAYPSNALLSSRKENTNVPAVQNRAGERNETGILFD